MLPAVGLLLVKFSTCAATISVKVVPSVEPYTLRVLFLLPVLLLSDAQSKLKVPAFTVVKSKNKSMAMEDVLSVAPVERITNDCVPL